MKDKLIEKFKPFSARTINADTIKYRDDNNYGKGWHNTARAARDYHTKNNVKIALEAIIEALSKVDNTGCYLGCNRKMIQEMEHYQKQLEDLDSRSQNQVGDNN